MLRHCRRRDIAAQLEKRSMQPWPRLDMPPPITTIDLSAIGVAPRLHILEHMRERRGEKRGFLRGHLRPEVDDPFVGRAAGQVHSINPPTKYLGIALAVR